MTKSDVAAPIEAAASATAASHLIENRAVIWSPPPPAEDEVDVESGLLVGAALFREPEEARLPLLTALDVDGERVASSGKIAIFDFFAPLFFMQCNYGYSKSYCSRLKREKDYLQIMYDVEKIVGLRAKGWSPSSSTALVRVSLVVSDPPRPRQPIAALQLRRSWSARGNLTHRNKAHESNNVWKDLLLGELHCFA